MTSSLLYLGAGADIATMFHNDLLVDRRRVIMVDARRDSDAGLSSEITRQLRMFKLIGPADEPNGHGDKDSFDWRLIDGGTLTLFANTPDDQLEEKVELRQVDAVMINRVSPSDGVFEALPFLATVHATPTGVDAVPTDFLGLVDLVEEGELNSDDEWVVDEDEFADLMSEDSSSLADDEREDDAL
jgi:hypothetical protein